MRKRRTETTAEFPGLLLALVQDWASLEAAEACSQLSLTCRIGRTASTHRNGAGGGIRTHVCQVGSLEPFRLATPA